MPPPLLRSALVLGLLSAIGPFAIDMYLPALPSIGQSLGASMGAVQASLMAFFIALGIGQVVYGPLSDMLGRKPPLCAGLLLFAAASVGCALWLPHNTEVGMEAGTRESQACLCCCCLCCCGVAGCAISSCLAAAGGCL